MTHRKWTADEKISVVLEMFKKDRSVTQICIMRGRTQQKSFLFLLEEKIRRAQNQKSRENFLLGGER
jgi:hypothetical protein